MTKIKQEFLAFKAMIYIIRNQRVMFDGDLAQLYGVEMKVLNQAVKRNKDRFPKDFMFQVNDSEAEMPFVKYSRYAFFSFIIELVLDFNMRDKNAIKQFKSKKFQQDSHLSSLSS